MTANPWSKFFWNDWENDPALKLCSFAAQGLWMRILCICAKADPKGYLVVAGRPLSPTGLSSLVGKPEPEVETLLRELATNGVFSTDRTGRIYSRRMVRDDKKSREAVKNGKQGGNPSLLNQREKSQGVNPPDNHRLKPHKPEASIQTKKEKPTVSRKKSSRLEADWTLPSPWRAWGLAQGASAQLIDREALKFRDYWLGAPGQKGLKQDWEATWRNWLRSSLERTGNGAMKARSAPGGDPVALLESFLRDGFWSPTWGQRPDNPESPLHGEWQSKRRAA